MKELWEELCEIEGIKFYDTPEMGVACRVSEINRAITGKVSHNNFQRGILDYEYVKNAFPDRVERENQMQDLEYNGTSKRLFVSLKLVLVHLENGYSDKYKEGWNRISQAIKENPILKSTPCFTSIKKILPQIEESSVLNSTSHSKHQEDTMKELCEIESIKFYNTPEMGIACRVSKINTAIAGAPNRGSFKRKMLGYEHVKEAFPNAEERNRQIQDLEYPGVGKQLFISLELVLIHLEKSNPKKYKEEHNRLLGSIKSNSVLLEDTTPDLNTTSNSGNVSPPKQQLLPTMEEEYSFLYIAKAGIADASMADVTDPQDIHFGITAGDPRDRIKAITSGSYKAQLIATIPFPGTQERSNGVKVACEDCVALETWFKSNQAWKDIRGVDESFRYEEPWITLLKEIENSSKTGPPFYALYPDSSVITEFVPEYLIPKIYDFGEGLEMTEIARFSNGDVIPDGDLKVFFDEDGRIVVQGLRRVKKR